MLVELVDQGNRLFFMAHAKKGTRPPAPVKVRRPGAVELESTPAAPRRQSPPTEVRAFLGGAVRYTGPPLPVPVTHPA